MGNSFKDTLKAALKKAGNFLFSSESSEKKKKGNFFREDQRTSGNKSSKELADQDGDDLQFAQVMQKEGETPAQFTQARIALKPPASPFSAGKVRHEAIVQEPPKKKETVQQKTPPQKHKPQQPVHTLKGPSKPSTSPKLTDKKTQKGEKKGAHTHTQAKPGYQISVNEPISLHPVLAEINSIKKQIVLSTNGSAEQIASTRIDDEREVVIGLDFGTASVKVVIGDNALGKAFAVPFSKELGLVSYLLPSRVWHDSDGYSLETTGSPLRNLKLKLIEKSCSMKSFSDAAVFLALVIRHARGWLFSEKADIYKRVHIQWKLTLGLPAESYNNHALVERFKKIAAAAWWLSRTEEKSIPEGLVEDICSRVWNMQVCDIQSAPELNTIDFDVVPELSAQIYGFLTSTKFDPRAKNIFMMVDIGAGTIDSSVFHVKRGRGNKLSFNFYSNFVEFNGVANLHTERIKWLRSAFQNTGVPQNVIKNLDMIEVPTDLLGGIPESINDYFNGIDFSFDSNEVCPDSDFFINRVKQQVTGKTLQKARVCVSSEKGFENMPIFLCGGGSRMKYYRKLEEELVYHPNASWFRFKPRKLEVPEILSAPGVVKDDFDRLSVAFGLSFLKVGEFVRGRPQEKTRPPVNVRNRCPGCGAVGTCYCD